MKGRFNIICALSKSNRGIGFKNDLVWRYKEDMDFFRKTTTLMSGTEPNSVIMGRKTWDSIPPKFKPLSDRKNIVVSRSMEPGWYKYDVKKDSEKSKGLKRLNIADNLAKILPVNYVRFASSLNKALEDVERFGNGTLKGQTFVIGGSQLYEHAIMLSECDKLFITEVDDNDKNWEFDVFFPKIPRWFKLMESVGGQNKDLRFDMYSNWSDNGSDEYQYINMLKQIVECGKEETGRNGKVYSIFGDFQHKFDLRKGFPLLTTKRMPFRMILKELLFFIRGETDAKLLDNKGVKIWNGNTTRDFLDNRGLNDYDVGDMGPMYGWNWRNFGAKYEGCDKDYTGKGYDQLLILIDNIVNDPSSRRLLLTTYDPSKVHESVLAPCHGLTVQFNVSKEYLDCKMYQRSVDTALGYPFNIASYAALMELIGYVTGLTPRYLFMTLGDSHIYSQHVDKVKAHFDRTPLKFPKFGIEKEFDYKNSSSQEKVQFLEELSYKDFKLSEYKYYPGIKMDMVA